MTGASAAKPLPSAPTAGQGTRSRGQSLVEFALLVPIVLLLLLAGVDLGRVYFATVNLTNVSRVGANFAAQHPDAWQGTGDPVRQARYQQLMRSDARGIDCTLPGTMPSPNFVDTGLSQFDLGSDVRVDLSCTFRLVTPLLGNLVGDGAGNLNVTASTTFTIRSGSVSGVVIGGASPSPTATPTAAPTPSPSPTAAPTPDPSAGPTPTPTAAPVVISFYGVPTSDDASGGGPPGSADEDQIVGVPQLNVIFHNTTVGVSGNCLWTFGDGTTSSSCGATVSKSYSTQGTYDVSLSVNAQPAVTRSAYVFVGCKVPAFAGVRVNSAPGLWTGAGFAAGNFSTLPGVGNYKIGFQSLAGGLVNPPGGCAGASVIVGP